jgi:hypothetical protein
LVRYRQPERAAGFGSSANDVWAVGNDCCYAYGSQEYTHSLIEHWNGSAWSIVPYPKDEPADSSLHAVAAISSADVWAVGNAPYPNNQALIEHWNGTTWSDANFYIGSLFQSDFAGVTAVSPNHYWAVGWEEPSQSNQVPQTLTEYFNGGRFTLTQSPNKEPKTGYHLTNQLTGTVALSPHNVWSVGLWRWYPGSGTTRSLSERWNGKKWKTEPGPASLESDNNNAFNQPLGIARVGAGLWSVGSLFADLHSEYGPTTLTVKATHG